MSYWDTFRNDAPGPKYLGLCEALAVAIRNGSIPPGKRLPSHRMLAKKLGVSVGTVTRAYEEAHRRGLVVGEVGRGSYASYFVPWSLSVIGEQRIPEHCIDLYQNLPVAIPEVEDRAWSEAFEALRGRPDLTALARSSWSEISTRREKAGAAWIGRLGLEVAPRRIRDCPGVMTALSAILGAMARPGDVLVTATLSHPLITSLCQQYSLKVRGVAIDDDGIVPAALDAICREDSPRLLYCAPTVHAPTAATIPSERRLEIAEIANRHDLIVIEDESAAFLLPNPPPPIATHARDRTFFIGDTWMALSLGLRNCYVAVPRAADASFARTLAASAGTAVPMMAEIAASWIEGDVADRLIAARRSHLAARNVLTREMLGPDGLHGHPYGHHVWLELPPPWRSDLFVRRGFDAGVAVHGAEWFTIESQRVPAAVRIAIGNAASLDTLRIALERLVSIRGSGNVEEGVSSRSR